MEIAYMIPQKKNYEGQGRRILQIEGAQQFENNFSIHPM